jgi:hypothetical protein
MKTYAKLNLHPRSGFFVSGGFLIGVRGSKSPWERTKQLETMRYYRYED